MATDLTTAYRAPITARRMATAAAEFLGALSDRERAVAAFPFDGDERYEWHYTPVSRNGLLLEQMGPEQRRAALALLETGVSARGATEAREIIALEAILRETDDAQAACDALTAAALDAGGVDNVTTVVIDR